jgi:flagellar hook-basal body complex protein FliE
MKIGELTGLNASKLLNVKPVEEKKEVNNLFANLISEVKENQQASKDMTKQFIAGGDIEIHEVMIAGEKAKTSLQLLMEVRNKALDMYKELTRMGI